MKTLFFLIIIILFTSSIYSQGKEQRNVINPIFEEWDKDADGKLSYEEYLTSFYSLFDANSNGDIDKGEWEKHSQLLVSVDTSGTTDEVTTGIRYGTSVDRPEIWNSWDTDASQSVNKEEFYDHVSEVFSNWDESGDNFINNEEFNRYWMGNDEKSSEKNLSD